MSLVVFAGTLCVFHASEFMLAVMFMRSDLSMKCELKKLLLQY
jgi:hypothetical protein